LGIELKVLVALALLQFLLLSLHGSYIALVPGLSWGTGRRDTLPKTNDVGRRIDRSIHNSLEALSIFVPLVMAIVLLGKSTSTTEFAALIFGGTRLAFVGIYLANIPYIRTVVWLIGMGALGVMFMALMI
jgi:uncharacterized MAPEG superfamily protein